MIGTALDARVVGHRLAERARVTRAGRRAAAATAATATTAAAARTAAIRAEHLLRVADARRLLALPAAFEVCWNTTVAALIVLAARSFDSP